MPDVTIIGVVYSSNQLTPRRVIVSTDGDNHVMAHQNSLMSGEKFLTIPFETFNKFTHPDHLKDHLSGILGPATSDVCAVIDHQDNIVAVVKADPRIDDHLMGHIIQDDDAVSGLKYDLANAKVLK